MDHLGLTFHLFVAADKLKHVLMDGWMREFNATFA